MTPLLPRGARSGRTGRQRLAPGLMVGGLLGPGTGDNMAAALGRRRRGRATWSSRSAPPGWCLAVADVHRRDATGTVAGFADATGRYLPLVCTLNAARVLDASRPDARGRPRRAVAAGAVGPGRVRRPGPGALPRGRADPEPARRDRRAARAAAGHGHAGPPRPGRGRGPAVRPRRRPGRARAHRASRIERVLLVGGGARSEARAPDRAGGARPTRSWCPRPGSTSPTARPGRPRGCSPGGAEPPAWELSGTQVFEADPVPARARPLRGGARAHRPQTLTPRRSRVTAGPSRSPRSPRGRPRSCAAAGAAGCRSRP